MLDNVYVLNGPGEKTHNTLKPETLSCSFNTMRLKTLIISRKKKKLGPHNTQNGRKPFEVVRLIGLNSRKSFPF